MKFSKTPKIDEHAITNIEMIFDVHLPDIYRDFLLSENGGIPRPNFLDTKHGAINVDIFYSIFHDDSKQTNSHSDLELMTKHFRAELDLPLEYLPIGRCNDEDLILITVTGKQSETLSWWSGIESGFQATQVVRIAKSLTDLFAKLEKPSNKKKKATRKVLDELEDAIIDENWNTVAEIHSRIDLSKLPADYDHPIFVSLEVGHLDTVEKLCAIGFSLDVKNDEDQTPIEWAEQKLSEAKAVPDRLKRQFHNRLHEELIQRVIREASEDIPKYEAVVDTLKKLQANER